MSEAAKLANLIREFKASVASNKISKYLPYGHPATLCKDGAIWKKKFSSGEWSEWSNNPWQVEFHAAGIDNQERMLMAANRVGKTMSAACEMTYHLTGDYPEWWKGKRFDGPILAWTGSPTNETSKDIVQTELLGGLGESLGTGWIPKAKIAGRPTTRQAGVKNVIDSFQVRHKLGGLSLCVLKTYEQGWQKWQGTAPHVVWLDEEPDDYKIFSEAQTRILTSHGIVFVTFTPLSGVTELVDHFRNGGDGIYLKGATWDDAPHLSQEDKDRLAASYRDHERDARTKGVPMMGEGAIFPISDEKIKCEPFEIPKHFARLKGCDFGYEHAGAGSEIAWDRGQDIIYVVDCYKERRQLAPYHAAWFNKSNRWIPVSWPHDGMNTAKGSIGEKVKEAYVNHGVNMLPKSARYPKATGQDKEKGGSQDQWPIIDEMRERMMTGRLKVFSHLAPWFEEKRSYHIRMSNAGKVEIVARNDDILKSTMYAIMMKRYAISENVAFSKRKSSAPSHPIASTRI